MVLVPAECVKVADKLDVVCDAVMALKSGLVDSSTMYVAPGSITGSHDTVYVTPDCTAEGTLACGVQVAVGPPLAKTYAFASSSPLCGSVTNVRARAFDNDPPVPGLTAALIVNDAPGGSDESPMQKDSGGTATPGKLSELKHRVLKPRLFCSGPTVPVPLLWLKSSMPMMNLPEQVFEPLLTVVAVHVPLLQLRVIPRLQAVWAVAGRVMSTAAAIERNRDRVKGQAS